MENEEKKTPLLFKKISWWIVILVCFALGCIMILLETSLIK